MKDRIACLGFGAITPLGHTARQTYEAVREGESALGLLPQGSPLGQDAVVSLFEDRSVLDNLSFFDTISIKAASQAIDASGIDPSSPRVSFILSTIKGNIEALGSEESDYSIAESATRIASYFRNPNPPLVVSNACISGLAALLQGRRMLLSGRCDYVVIIGTEVQSRFIISGFQSLKAVSASPCKPFDDSRDGLNLGEASAAIVLGRSEEGWEIADGAVRNDAYHISSPSRTGEGSYKVLRYVLDSVDVKDLAFVNVHGTATLFNDEMEAVALDRAGLGDIPINSLKGFLGHTMGAAGVIESILSILACEDGVVLPTRGFSEIGVSRHVNISSEERPCEGKAFIKLMSGFGGVNGALLFRKGGRV